MGTPYNIMCLLCIASAAGWGGHAAAEHQLGAAPARHRLPVSCLCVVRHRPSLCLISAAGWGGHAAAEHQLGAAPARHPVCVWSVIAPLSVSSQLLGGEDMQQLNINWVRRQSGIVSVCGPSSPLSLSHRSCWVGRTCSS